MSKRVLVAFFLIISPYIHAAKAESDQEEPATDNGIGPDKSSYPRHGMGLSLGLGFSAVSIEGKLIRQENRYYETHIGGYFSTYKQDDRKETFYGPEVDGVLKWPNPSILTPFVGGGFGYRKWQRIDHDEEFDGASSWMMHYFFGGELRFHRNFAILIAQKWDQYLNQRPRKFSDHSEYDSWTKSRFIMSVVVSI